MDNIKYIIFKFDNTYYIKFKKCVREMDHYFQKHEIILITYDCVIEEDRKFFYNFDLNVHKYIKKQIKLNKIFNQK